MRPRRSRILPAILLILLSGLTGRPGGGLVDAAGGITDEGFLSRLAGAWSGEGEVMGAASEITAAWDWTLQGKFLRLEFRNEMTLPGGATRLFEGVAYYHAAPGGGYEGTWADTNGNLHPIRATDDGRALTSLWGEPGGGHYGMTVYRLTGESTMEVVDSIRGKDGTFEEFGRSTLIRREQSRASP